jgi:hypothetical protein
MESSAQLAFQDLIDSGYFLAYLSPKSSRANRAASSVAALYIFLRSEVKDFISLYEINLVEFLIW